MKLSTLTEDADDGIKAVEGKQKTRTRGTAKTSNLPSEDSSSSKTCVPSKRTNRLNSAPCNIRNPVVVLSPIDETGNKYKRATKQHGSKASTVRNHDSDDSTSKLIAMHCQLTSEVLETKKLLSEKCNALLKLNQDYCQSQLEVVVLKNSNEDKDRQINILRKELEQLKAERFATDLIRFDDEIIDLVPTKEPSEASGVSAEMMDELIPQINTPSDNTKFQWTPID